MLRLTTRAGRRPLALTLALAVLGACADDPSAPTLTATPTPDATLADPFTVSNTNDSGIGSLRWVLGYATGGETIRFDPALAGQTIALDSTLYLRKPVTIEGPAGTGITIDARDNARAIEIKTVGSYRLRNVSITGGNAGTSVGGAIADFDFLNGVALVLENTLVYGNKSGSAVAIWVDGVTLINSTVSGNTSTSTPSSSYAAVMARAVVLINSTVAYNAYGGVGPASGDARVTLQNSILSNNDGKNCQFSAGSVTREGTNLSDDDSCGGPTQILIGDARLGPLADNGGPAMTHALLAGSPAINAGTSCTVQVDQRYVPRDSQCDLGAFEFVDFTTVTVTIDPGVGVNRNGWAVLTGTVACSRSETFNLAVQLVQEQKSGKSVTSVDAANIVPVECSTAPRPWTASMVLTSGSFQNGSGTASAQTVNAEPWVAPASATGPVRLYWSRR